MNSLLNERARRLSPYTAGEQPKEKLIKLNTNENAYPPSPKVAAAVAEAAQSLRLYPPADSGALKETLAELHGLKAENFFCSNGSDEALALCFYAFFGDGVKTMDVTYSFYPVWAKLVGAELDIVPLMEDYTVDISGMRGGRGAIIANPNAPTGIALGLDDVAAIAEATHGVAVVDEAYVDFGAKSAIGLVNEIKNLVVVRTLSKSHSLAGLRVGYAAACPELAAALHTVKDSFNSYPLDMLAQAGAKAALMDVEWFRQNTEKIVRERGRVSRELERLGCEVLPSSANFVFVRCEYAEETYTALRKKGILVRYFNGERTRDFLRVTVGTPMEMDVFLKAMEEIV